MVIVVAKKISIAICKDHAIYSKADRLSLGYLSYNNTTSGYFVTK